MDAYEVLKNRDSSKPIDAVYFYKLISKFQEQYLLKRNYSERLSLHRNPIEVKNDLLEELYPYLQKIQNRDEMRYIDAEKRSSGYVPTRVMDIWRSDKRLKSCYDAIKVYCKLTLADFNLIAIHIAEYRAMSKLASKIERSKNRPIISLFSVSLNTEAHQSPYAMKFDL